MNRRRRGMEFTRPLFLGEPGNESELNQTYITSVSRTSSANSTDSLASKDIPIIDLTVDDDDKIPQNHPFNSSHQTTVSTINPSDASFHTAVSKTKQEASSKSSLSSMEKDSLEESSIHASFKENVKRSLFRRLSVEFQRKPIDFTRKLVSVLEQSFVTSFTDEHKQGDVSLDKITGEFIKLCKFIEDETMPEMAPSFTSEGGFSPTKLMSPQKLSSVLGLHKNATPNTLFKSIISKLQSSPQTMKFGSNNSTPSKVNDDTNTFEFLERFCKNSEEEEEQQQPKNRGKELAPLDASIYAICKQQMASLDDDLSEEEDTERAAEDSITDYYTPMQSFTEKRPTSSSYDTNEMKESIQEEIMKYKQRCLEFARQMSEIENEAGDFEEEPEDKTARSGIYLLETLNRCVEYKNLLVNKVEKKRKDAKRTLVFPNPPSDANQKTATKTTVPSTSRLPTKPRITSVKKLTGTSTLPIRKPAADSQLKVRETEPRKQLLQVFPPSVNTPIRSPAVRPIGSQDKRKTESKVPGLIKAVSSSNLGTASSSGRMAPPRTPHSATPSMLSKRSSVKKEPEVGGRTPRAPLYKAKSIERIPSMHLAEKKTPASVCKKSFVKPQAGLRSEVPRQRLNLSKMMEEISKCETTKSTLPSSSLPSVQRVKSPVQRYFVTPGKVVERINKRIHQKGSFFKDPVGTVELSGDSKEPGSPKSASKLKYKNVASPLSKYIHYENTNLLQNVHASNNDMLLTPEKNDPTDAIKIPLSAKTPNTDTENPALPRVFYKSANHVQVTQHSPKPLPCRGVLEQITNKVVLKHTGRIQNEADDEISVIEEKQAYY